MSGKHGKIPTNESSEINLVSVWRRRRLINMSTWNVIASNEKSVCVHEDILDVLLATV